MLARVYSDWQSHFGVLQWFERCINHENGYLYSRFGWFWQTMQCMNAQMKSCFPGTTDVFWLLYRTLRYSLQFCCLTVQPSRRRGWAVKHRKCKTWPDTCFWTRKQNSLIFVRHVTRFENTFTIALFFFHVVKKQIPFPLRYPRDSWYDFALTRPSIWGGRGFCLLR